MARRRFLLFALVWMIGLAVGSGTLWAQATVPVSEEVVVRGDPSRPNVALVINIGAGFEPAVGMLDTLAEKEYRTTFFVMGWWAEQNPELLRRIADEGHEIASHGHRVPLLTQVSDAEIAADLEQADAAISAVIGRTTRPLWSASASDSSPRVRRVAASLGYRQIFWTVNGFDWRRDSTAEGVYRQVVNNVVNGAIVELHFDSPTTVNSTAVALPRMIDTLRAEGFKLVTITELLTAP
jgi:peptidoglycan/xylan/chitin deacetylase (PgdA/CDA1 family)